MKILHELTNKEQLVLDSLIGLLYAEAGFSDVDVNDIAEDINISQKIIRGVLSSLVKKGIILIEENESKYQII